MSDITTPQTQQQQVKITVPRKTVVRALAIFIVLGGMLIDFWDIGLLSGSGTAYEATQIVFNIVNVMIFAAVGAVLWVLAD